MNLRSLFAASLATVALLASASGARADYTVDTTSGGVHTFGKSTLTLTGTNSTVQSGDVYVNVQNVLLTSTQNPATTDKATIPFSFNLTINQVGGGTAMETVNGSFSITRSDRAGERSTVSFSALTPLVIANTTYDISFVSYAAPTIGNPGGGGNITFEVNPTTAVPEPASLAMMGIGLGGLGLVRRLRRRTV